MYLVGVLELIRKQDLGFATDLGADLGFEIANDSVHFAVDFRIGKGFGIIVKR